MRHHANSEVDAVLGMCEIGAIRRLDFGRGNGAASGSQSARSLALEEAFRSWVRTLYLVTEMENTLDLDFSLRGLQVTGGEAPGELSLFKIQMLGEGHDRFLSNTLDSLTGKPLPKLWAVTSALCNASAGSGWIGRAFATVNASEEGRLARGCGTRLKELSARIVACRANGADPSPTWSQLLSLAALVEQEARWLNRELKLTRVERVRQFENHQRDVIEKAGNRLIASLEKLPGLIALYYAHLAHGLHRLQLTPAVLDRDSRVRAEALQTP